MPCVLRRNCPARFPGLTPAELFAVIRWHGHCFRCGADLHAQSGLPKFQLLDNGRLDPICDGCVEYITDAGIAVWEPTGA